MLILSASSWHVGPVKARMTQLLQQMWKHERDVIQWFLYKIQPLTSWELFSCSVVSDSLWPGTAACQVSLSFTVSWSPFKLMSVESMIPSHHLIVCHPLFLLPSIFPSIRVFSNDTQLSKYIQLICLFWCDWGTRISSNFFPNTT